MLVTCKLSVSFIQALQLHGLLPTPINKPFIYISLDVRTALHEPPKIWLGAVHCYSSNSQSIVLPKKDH